MSLMNFDLDAFRQNEASFMAQLNAVMQAASSDEEEPPRYDADLIIDQQEDEAMQILTNFNCQQFSELFRQVEPFMLACHSGGRKSKISIKTMFMITICFCKHAMSWRLLQGQFGLDSSYIERIVITTIATCHMVLFNIHVKWYMHEENERDLTLFENFPNAICAIDASVQEISRPRQNQKQWYSGKHKKHCIKVQAAVGPKGLLMDVRGPVPGSIHDFHLFEASNILPTLLAERNRYLALNPNKPALSALFDKGYIGIKNIFPGAEIPFKSGRQQLTQYQMDYNAKVGQDRVLVERWFGRHKSLWKIMFIRFNLRITNYGAIYKFCAGLTNYHIKHKPLTENDPITLND